MFAPCYSIKGKYICDYVYTGTEMVLRNNKAFKFTKPWVWSIQEFLAGFFISWMIQFMMKATDRSLGRIERHILEVMEGRALTADHIYLRTTLAGIDYTHIDRCIELLEKKGYIRRYRTNELITVWIAVD